MGSVVNQRYRLLRLLGEGGMGQVFLAADLLNGEQKVALKTLRNGLLVEDTAARLKDEFRAMTRLRHPNLVRVFDFGVLEENGQPFLTLEFLDGQDLTRFTAVEIRPFLPDLIAQLARALDFIHTRGLLHNDIKPQNIFLLRRPDGFSDTPFQAKLMDFGLARLAGQENPAMSGTVHYAAPEVFLNEKVDARADLYSLGVVLYRLATGSLPFPGREPVAVIRAHREAPPPPPREVDPTLPEGIERLILWLLEKNPEDRPRSAAALVRALNEATGSDFSLETHETRESYLTGATLVGRDAEMGVLRAALAAISSPAPGAAAGAPRLILVGGESGAGKSRLLRELRYQTQTEGLRFLVGSCYETGNAAYQPFVEAFRFLVPMVRQILQSRDGEGDLTRSGEILGPLLPEMFPAPGPEPAASPEAKAVKARLFEMASEILTQIASRYPFVLALEDLHWADALTIEFLRHLRDRTAGAAFLVVATYRDDEVAGRPLEGLAAGGEAAAGQLVLRLRRLEGQQITHLIRSMLSLDEDPEELSLLLQRQTAGNPLFIEEILRALVEDSTLRREDGKWQVDLAHLGELEVPRTINETLGRRLAHLSPDERKLARVLSVFNRPTPPALLRRAGPWRGDEMEVAVATLCARGILVLTEDGGEERVTFAHVKARELVYRGIGPERTRLHLTAGELLEEMAGARGDEAIEELAYHFLQAGAKSKSLEYAERAGDKSTRVYAYPAALDFYQKALALLPRSVPARRLEILSKIARVHTQAANYTEMQDFLNRSLRIARSLGDRAREGHLIASVAFGHLLQGHLELVVRNARTALALFEPLGDQLGMGRAKNLIGRAYARMGRLDEAVPHFTQALEHFTAAGDRWQVGMVRGNLGTIHLCRNESEKAVRLFREALQTWRDIGDEGGTAMTLTNLGQALKDLGQFDEAIACIAEAVRLHRKTLDRTNLAISLTSLAEIDLVRGAYDRAIQQGEESLRIRREIGDHWTAAYSLDLVGTARRCSGDLLGAVEYHQEGLRLAREQKIETQEGFLLAAMALDALEEGKPKEAVLSGEKALVLGRRLRSRKIQFLALRALAAAALQAGRVREAASRARDLEALSTQGGSAEERVRAALATAQILLAEGHPERAQAALEGASENALRVGRTDLLAEIRLVGAGVAEQVGSPVRALESTRAAVEAFREIASRMEDSAVRRRYLATGARAPALERIARENAETGRPEPAAHGAKVPPVKLLATMYEISQIINTIRDLTELLNRVLDLAIQIVNAERGIILLVDEPTGELKVRVARDLERETIRDAGEYSRRILQEAREGRSIVSLDAGTDARFEGFESVSLYNIRSLICVPLRIRDRILGTVYLDSRRPETLFGEEDVEFLGAFANQAAIAIENAQLYESLREENLYLKRTVESRYGFENIIGKSAVLEKVLERLARVADSHLPVVIQGESGTGKELVARAIHHNSPRRDRRFLSENVAALPETLLESELFGYVRGAFTGAEQDKPGLFEVADGGTLFLDEVGEMSLALQGKLLRVVQEGEIRPVGGNRSRKVDVRVLAATNKDLKRLVAEKKFREDLFYRLNVVTLTLPPLRQRKEDLPLLVDHFLNKIARETGSRPLTIEPTVLALLARHDWPGNIRELENTISRLSLFASGPNITLADLARDPDLLDRVTDLPSHRTTPEPDLHRQDVKHALKATLGNRVQAAALLGISRATLFRKIKQFQIKG